jgi:hypothetical protein
MPITKAENTEKNYNALQGGFKGLFNSMDPHLIPDGYLAAMENLEVDENGVIHAVEPPAATSAPTDRSCSYCGCPVWQDYSISDLATGTYLNNVPDTIDSADSAFTPSGDVYTSGGGYDWAIYLNRFYYNIGNILRYSGVSKLHLAATWTGRNVYNFQVYPFGITHLQPMQSGLYVIGDGVICRMTEPNVGGISEVYYGPRTPVNHGTGSYILNNGSSLVYCASDGIYHFGGSGDPQKIDTPILTTLPISEFYAAEYHRRLWVLEVITGSTPRLYAMNKTTGYWEYYNTQNIVASHSLVKLGWPRSQSTIALDIKDSDGDWYNFTKMGSDTGTRMPWTFTTKDFTPSFDAYSRVVHVKFFYLGQTGASTVATIQVYGDGVLIESITQEMLGTGLLHVDYDCAPTLANSFHIVVTGTGKADIIDAGIEFTVRHKGDLNA